MKIISLMENTASHPDLHAEHGLSLYIETDAHKILFDAGQTDLFAENAEKLGVDLRAVDIAFLSHGHYDHSGGLMRFLELNDHAPLYMNERAFSDCWHGEDHYIGIDPGLKASGRIRLTGDALCIDGELSLMTCSDKQRVFPLSGAGLTVRQPDGTFQQDEFLHEQYLSIKEKGRHVLISGCSHKGILNIMSWLKPDVLIGGFHFMKADPVQQRDELLASADSLCRYDTVYYTCHCTGEAQFSVLKERMGDKLHYLRAGDRLEV